MLQCLQILKSWISSRHRSSTWHAKSCNINFRESKNNQSLNTLSKSNLPPRVTWHPHSPLRAKKIVQDAALILHKPKIGFTLPVGGFVSIFSKRGPLNVHAAPKFFDFFGLILIFVYFWGMTCLVSDIRHKSWQQTVSVFVPDFNDILHKKMVSADWREF